jgi:hypothetical protein
LKLPSAVAIVGRALFNVTVGWALTCSRTICTLALLAAFRSAICASSSSLRFSSASSRAESASACSWLMPLGDGFAVTMAWRVRQARRCREGRPLRRRGLCGGLVQVRSSLPLVGMKLNALILSLQ